MTAVLEKNTKKVEKPLSKNKLLGIAGLAWMFDAMDVGILIRYCCIGK